VLTRQIFQWTLESWWVDADAALDARRGCEGEPVEAVAEAGDRDFLLGVIEVAGSSLYLGEVRDGVVRGAFSPVSCGIDDLGLVLDAPTERSAAPEGCVGKSGTAGS
jgi:hypothetical protein